MFSDKTFKIKNEKCVSICNLWVRRHFYIFYVLFFLKHIAKKWSKMSTLGAAPKNDEKVVPGPPRTPPNRTFPTLKFPKITKNAEKKWFCSLPVFSSFFGTVFFRFFSFLGSQNGVPSFGSRSFFCNLGVSKTFLELGWAPGSISNPILVDFWSILDRFWDALFDEFLAAVWSNLLQKPD